MKQTSSNDKRVLKMDENKIIAKGILFDLDGTIFDTIPAYIEAAKITFKTIGCPLPENGKLLQIAKSIEQKESLRDLINGDPNTFLPIYLKAFYDISTHKAKPFPNVACTLETLSKKAKLSVITMRFVPGGAITNELKQFGLDKYFAHVVTSLDTHKPKPSPEGLIKAVTAMDVQMCDCVIIGDSTVDVMAGKAAGIKTVSVLTGLYSREELAKVNPDFIINDISELPKLIK